jgi:hypothetical protein
MEMATSQNGWPVLAGDSPKLHTWVIPARSGTIRVRLRNGSAGFLLAHLLLWFAEVIEPLHGNIVDDWGYAFRSIRGRTTGFSNHASGTAADANSTRHPLSLRGTFRPWQYVRIRARLLVYVGCIRWGGDYVNRADEMHFEINKPMASCEQRARRLSKSKRGIRLLHANPGQRAVIFS